MDQNVGAESCPPKRYILRLRLGLRDVWPNVTESLIDVGYFCSKKTPQKKPHPKVLTEKSPKIGEHGSRQILPDY